MAQQGSSTELLTPPDSSSQLKALLRSGRYLSDELRSQLVAAGNNVVPGLIDIVIDDDLMQDDSIGDGWAPLHAADILGDVGAVEAVEPLYDVLQRCDYMDTLLDVTVSALGRFGAAAVEPGLRRCALGKDTPMLHAICDVLCKTNVADERIYHLFLDVFAETPDYGSGCLGAYGDPRALEHLYRAFDEIEVIPKGNIFSNNVFIDLQWAIEQLGGTLSKGQLQKLYGTQKAKRRFMRSSRISIKKRRPRRSELRSEEPDQIRSSETRVRSTPKMGRNQPCWCGSGKKVKRCHGPLES